MTESSFKIPHPLRVFMKVSLSRGSQTQPMGSMFSAEDIYPSHQLIFFYHHCLFCLVANLSRPTVHIFGIYSTLSNSPPLCLSTPPLSLGKRFSNIGPLTTIVHSFYFLKVIGPSKDL